MPVADPMFSAGSPAEPHEPEQVELTREAKPKAASPARKPRQQPPARKARTSAKLAAPAAATPEAPPQPTAAPAPGRPVFVPTVSYERQTDTLRIELLDEPVSDERWTEKLNAGYTADGRLAGLLIFDVAKHAEPPAPAPELPAKAVSTPDSALAAKLDKLQEELRILKTGLALALGGLAIVLLRIF